MARRENAALTWTLRAFILLNIMSAAGFIAYALILENPPKTALPLWVLAGRRRRCHKATTASPASPPLNLCYQLLDVLLALPALSACRGLLIVGIFSLVVCLFGIIGSCRIACCLNWYMVLGGVLTLGGCCAALLGSMVAMWWVLAALRDGHEYCC
jgi:hypothetical protein